MYERVKKKSYLVKNIKNSRLAAIFSVPIFYHKFYLFSSKSEIYKYSDIAWLVILTQIITSYITRVSWVVTRTYRTHQHWSFIV